MRQLFVTRLKADVGLDDAQIAEVLPKIEALERDRMKIQRERGATVRQLRQGINAGASDHDLQVHLDRLDTLSDELQRTTRDGLRAIDVSLTVPQRVRIRLVIVKFRAEMAERIREFRHAGGGRRRFGEEPPETPDAADPSNP